jgi:NADH-quinone oxidoreductase subunit C
MSTSTPEAPALEAGHHQRILDVLGKELGDALVGSVLERGDVWVRVDRAAWHRALEVCKRQLGLTFFSFLSGIDWQPAPGLSGERSFRGEEGDDEADDEAAVEEVAEVRTGLAGGDTRFQVFARLYDVRRHVGVTLKADLDDSDPRVATVTDLFRGADWHERETWEMFGFAFDGHPGLRHLYLPGEFEGHPLRKDFPLLAREVKPWPGLVNVEQIPAHLDPKNQPKAEEPAPEATPADSPEASPEPGGAA